VLGAHTCNPSYEIRRIMVRGQLRQIVWATLSAKWPELNGLEVWFKRYHACFVSTKPWIQTPVTHTKKAS
jgi:hypothetical protein